MIIFNKVMIPPKEKVMEAFSQVLEEGMLTNNGPVVQKLESELKRDTGTHYALSTSNGTIALQLAIRALHLKGEIITTPFTFVATTSSILWENCTPIFADIDPDTLCIDPKSIKDKISERTVGILPVHIYGNACDIDGIEKVAQNNGLKTIYDGAQAYGSKYIGKSVMAYGNISALSLHAYKILSTIEGGALFCSDRSISEELFRIRYFGKASNNEVVQLGINGKMSEINAAFGLVSLMELQHEIARRKTIYEYYLNQLQNIGGLRFQKINPEVEINYAYFPIIFSSEKDLLRIIEIGKKKGVELRRYFYPLLTSMKFLNCNPEDTPVAYDISKRIACLPLYGTLSQKEIEKIVSLIKENL